MALPDELRVLLTDEPVLDLYSRPPWRVPDGTAEDVRRRLEEVVGRWDGACEPGSVVLAASRPLLDLLSGAGARGGAYGDLAGGILRPFLSPRAAVPDHHLSEAVSVPELRLLRERYGPEKAFEIVRDLLAAVEGLEPLEPRRRALLELFADPPPGIGDARGRAWRDGWAAHAGDGVLAVLPEAAGYTGYLEWICGGLFAVHGRLCAASSTTWDEPYLLRDLLLAAKLAAVPNALLAALPSERFGTLIDDVASGSPVPAGAQWAARTRAWLRRLLWAGEAGACRAWIDLAVRFAAATTAATAATADTVRKGAPLGLHATPYLDLLRDFQTDLREIWGPYRSAPPNPIAAGDGPAGTASAGGGAGTAPAAEEQADDRTIDQPELAAAIQDVADGSGPVRLLIAGPDGTGKRRAAKRMNELVTARPGSVREAPFWLAADYLNGMNIFSATTYLADVARESAGQRVLIIDGLDAAAREPFNGEAVVEELHRSIDLFPDLNIIALCETGGDERIREINPALALRFTVVRSRPFTAAGYRELFDKAVRRSGASATRPALDAAAELLLRTRPVRNMRNARLANRLAGTVVESARRRTPGGAAPVVRRGDIPASLDVTGATGDPLAELASLTGLAAVKRQVELVLAEARAAETRAAAGLTVTPPTRHMVLTGGPGTGKTEVARLLARVFADLGLLSSGHVVEVTPTDLVGQNYGQPRQVIERAIGGALLIDEAYVLGRGDSNSMADAVATLVKLMEDHGDDLVVFAAGYQREMQDFLSANPGLASRFPVTLHFPDYTDEDLVEIFVGQAAKAGLRLGDGAREKVADLLRRAPRGKSFGNARVMRNLCQRALPLQADRVLNAGGGEKDLAILLPEDIPDSLSGATRTVADGDPFAELAAMVGLDEVKAEVRALMAEARVLEARRVAGQRVPMPTRHMVFSGNPGTAKTTVARLIARIYARLELLSSGHLVEVTRADLVGEYLGHTAPKVHRVVEQAMGGVLFIDEAYALHQDRFGAEAVAALVKLMEDNRTDLIVIAAGYEDEMTRFLDANSGLRSRFAKHLRFRDYSDKELVGIFEHAASVDGFALADGVTGALFDLLRRAGRGPAFGNGRFMRNLLDATISAQAQRLATGERPGTEDVVTLLVEDLPEPERADGGGRAGAVGNYL
ncbi:AAA family ATPase [Spirillospora sp. NPDC029432]|uniref:AAA family ATPase n=1 Tax=Spirillospora sp. NPDC029432 TaxID=3154599 RepID=UPI003454AF44